MASVSNIFFYTAASLMSVWGLYILWYHYHIVEGLGPLILGGFVLCDLRKGLRDVVGKSWARRERERERTG